MPEDATELPLVKTVSIREQQIDDLILCLPIINHTIKMLIAGMTELTKQLNDMQKYIYGGKDDRLN